MTSDFVLIGVVIFSGCFALVMPRTWTDRVLLFLLFAVCAFTPRCCLSQPAHAGEAFAATRTLDLLVALGCSPLGASLYAPHLAYLAPQLGVDVDQAAAVLASESHCRPWVRSHAGDRGGWQLRPGAATLGKGTYSEEQLHRPGISTWLALRWMAYGRDKCGAGLLMLGFYGGGDCRHGKRYTRRVWLRLARARRALGDAPDAPPSSPPGDWHEQER